MAEALAIVSIVANIVQIVDLSERIILRLDDFHDVVSHSPKAFRQTQSEIPLLVDTLKQTQKAIDAGSVPADTARALSPVVEGCRERLGELESLVVAALPKQNDSTRVRHYKALASIVKESKIEKINRSIHRYIETLTFYHAAAAASKSHTSLGEKLSRLRRWLSAPDPSHTHYKLANEHLANTNLWFLKGDKYRLWKKRESDSVMWLYGIPGSGKSFLCSAIVEDISEDCKLDAGKALGYYYFAFSNSDNQAPELMVKSLICQLSERCVRIPAILDSILSTDPTGQRHPPLHRLLEILHAFVQGIPATYIIIDALDECGDRAGLLHIICRMKQWEVDGLHMIILSRDELDIRIEIEEAVDEDNMVCLHSSLLEGDIRQYVRHRLANDKKLKRLSQDLEMQEEIEISIMEKADGMFQWVACQVDMLRNSLSRAELRQALRNLPETLGATYERILSAIDEDFRDHALTILRWLAFSPRPLYAEEAAEIVAISSEDAIPTFDRDQILLDPSDILTICTSLVTVTSLPAIGPAPMDLAQKGTVYGRRAFTLAHFSVKEYLLSDLIHNSPAAAFSIQDATSQAFIAKSCLGYMLQFRKLESVTWQTFDEFQLLDYAARFWPYHARAAGSVRLSLQPLALELMSLEDDAYLNWCRIYDVDGVAVSPAHWTSVDQIASPLYTASAFGLTDIVERLLFERGFEVNQRSRVHGTPLQAASFHGFDETVQFLLANGADPNLYQQDKPSALQLASASGHLKVVEHLIRAEIHIDALSDKYGTALQAASSNGHTEIVRTLIANRADINAQGGEYGTALIAALGAEHHTIVHLLLDAGADIHINGGIFDNTLQAAAYAGENELIHRLLDTGVQVNRQGGTYGTALQAAAFKGHLQTVEILLEAGADINILGGEYGSALQAASMKNHVEIVRRLLGAGADVNAEIGWDVTALHASISGGSSVDIIELLLAAGADYGFVHKSFGTPLHNAAMFGRLGVIERLLKAGAAVNAQHSDLGGAVQVAAWHAKEKVVELLLAHGADISFEGPNKSTVRQQALYFGWKLKSLSEYEESEAEGTWRCNTKHPHESSVSLR